jgi:hypothetical protein
VEATVDAGSRDDIVVMFDFFELAAFVLRAWPLERHFGGRFIRWRDESSAPHRPSNRPGLGWPGDQAGGYPEAWVAWGGAPYHQCSVDCSQIGIDLGPCAPKRISLIPSATCASLYSMHVLPKMDTSFDPDDDLSTAFGPETLTERDMVPAAYQNASSSNTDLPVEVIGGGRFLKVDQSANLRANSLTSKIWQHGFEYRALAKKFITPERSTLSDATIEASECLKAW